MHFKLRLLLLALFSQCVLSAQMWMPSAPTLIGSIADNNFAAEIDLAEDGQRMAVISRGSTLDFPLSNYGSVQTYDLIDGSWTEIGQLIEGDNIGDGQFLTMHISGNGQSLILARRGNFSNGTVKIFDLTGDTWVQRGATIERPNSTSLYAW